MESLLTNNPKILEPEVMLEPPPLYNYEILKEYQILQLGLEKKPNFTFDMNLNKDAKKKKKKTDTNVKYNLDFDIKKFIPSDEEETQKAFQSTPKMSKFNFI